jgi:hypothetical protein
MQKIPISDLACDVFLAYFGALTLFLQLEASEMPFTYIVNVCCLILACSTFITFFRLI